MDEDISGLPCFLDPLEGRPEGIRGVLGVAVVEIELQVDEVLWISEVQVHSRTDCRDLVLAEFLYVVCKIVAAYPDFSQLAFVLENALPPAIIGSE